MHVLLFGRNQTSRRDRLNVRLVPVADIKRLEGDECSRFPYGFETAGVFAPLEDFLSGDFWRAGIAALQASSAELWASAFAFDSLTAAAQSSIFLLQAFASST